MQEINELLSRQQYVFFTRSPVERNRVCVGSGLDRSASTAFRSFHYSIWEIHGVGISRIPQASPRQENRPSA